MKKAILLGISMYAILSCGAVAQAKDAKIHTATKLNSYGAKTYLDDKFFESEADLPILKCLKYCDGFYGMQFDENKKTWSIIALNNKPIAPGARFQITHNGVTSGRHNNTDFTITQSLSDIINLCQTSIGISITPVFSGNDENFDDLAFGLVFFNSSYDHNTKIISLKFGIDRPMKDDYYFHYAMDKMNNDCFSGGVSRENYRAHTAEMVIPALQARILDSVTLTENLTPYVTIGGKKIPVEVNKKELFGQSPKLKPVPKIPTQSIIKPKLPKPN